MRVVKKKSGQITLETWQEKSFVTFSLFLLIWCLCLSIEWVSLGLTENIASPGEGRWGGGGARTSGPKTAGEISYSPGRRLSNPNIYNLPISADRLITKAKNEILPSLALQPRGKPKEQCPVLLTSQVWKHHAKRVVKIPYHAVQPSSEAQHIFCSMWWCASSWTEQKRKKWRK